jgi:uncharacterized Zn-finger protein
MTEQIERSERIEQIEETTEEIVSCEGVGLIFGHPKIYLEMEESGEVYCPYCSKKFVSVSS